MLPQHDEHRHEHSMTFGKEEKEQYTANRIGTVRYDTILYTIIYYILSINNSTIVEPVCV